MKPLIIALLLTGCAYNPYQQPHFDWHWKLVPTEELKHEGVNYCAVYA